jgi:hypothetical protein
MSVLQPSVRAAAVKAAAVKTADRFQSARIEVISSRGKTIGDNLRAILPVPLLIVKSRHLPRRHGQSYQPMRCATFCTSERRIGASMITGTEMTTW